MKELLRSNDPVTLSIATSILRGEGIEVFHLDQHASILEGSIGAIQQRLMVADRDHFRGKAILRDHGIES
ncbi:DUF2007 domain-containing protein [Paracoccus pacificus]|uniref:DUF2007 domain-containing protein n=1 Tax=Paracoccus pacificus TaxID=1463598 RepID=A0ABW4R2K5_9RHOB